jgi:hypothetical protein
MPPLQGPLESTYIHACENAFNFPQNAMNPPASLDCQHASKCCRNWWVAWFVCLACFITCFGFICTRLNLFHWVAWQSRCFSIMQWIWACAKSLQYGKCIGMPMRAIKKLQITNIRTHSTYWHIAYCLLPIAYYLSHNILMFFLLVGGWGGARRGAGGGSGSVQFISI